MSPIRKPRGLPRAAAILSAAILSACAVGPNFKRPAAPMVSDYTSPPLGGTTATPNTGAGEAQRFLKGSDVTGDWWTLYHSQPLDELIAQSLTANPDLGAARAALSVARENVLSQRGAYYPSLSAGFSASRQRQSGQIAPAPNSNLFLYNLFTPQVSVSYVPDVFGLNRRTVESLGAQAEEARFQLIATYNTLTSNVVVTAIQEASLEAQVKATQELIDINKHLLDILQYQFAKGYASRLDVAAQETQLAQVLATLPPLVKQLAQLRDLLAVLAGHFPADSPAAHFELTSLTLPQDLPLSLPSALVEQRPDVRQAQANLHDASAKIGIAIANRFPNITLSANTGSTALAMNELFTTGTGFWSIGAELTAPIFQGGTLLHQEHAAKAAYRQAAEQYRGTVLAAFQDVADTLAALDQDAEGLKAASAAEAAAKVSLDLAQEQYQRGYASFLALLNAEQAYQQARVALVQAQAARLADSAALFQALGGGWWHRPDLASDADAK
ncbi:MAG TPA: efflux transporter outer membrane subunit [Steroidobacteraceae bacterium]|nr:efflux transporter outer membrane subunit [Steroidobacteraceae bacterium]